MTKLSESKVGYRKYPHNLHRIFDKSEQSMYWLGFIAADGCVSKIKVAHGYSYKLTIGVAEKDLQHLLEFQNYISYNKFPYYNYKTKSVNMTVTISKEEFNSFYKYNISERKSLVLIPPPIEDSKSYPFIIGYIDGDGSWNRSVRDNCIRLGIRGTPEFLNWIKHIFDSNFPATRNLSKVSLSDGYGYYQIMGKRANKIMESLSSVNIYKLKRKWGGQPYEEKYKTPYNRG